MAKWIEACDESDVRTGDKWCTEVEGFALVLCNLEGRMFAAANICPHAGMPLGDGDLVGPNLTCPYHAYTYNMKTGKNIDDPSDMGLVMFPIRIVDGRVQVQLPLAE